MTQSPLDSKQQPDLGWLPQSHQLYQTKKEMSGEDNLAEFSQYWELFDLACKQEDAYEDYALTDYFTVNNDEIEKIYQASGVTYKAISNYVLDSRCLVTQRKSHEYRELRSRAICLICQGVVRIPKILRCINCSHLYCEVCVESLAPSLQTTKASPD